MSAPAIVWTLTAVGFVVLLALAGRQLLRALGDAKRAASRVSAYRDLPLVAALTRAQSDAVRLGASLEAVEPLLVRAQTATATIRRGPLPPDLVAAVVRVRDEIAAFRRLGNP